jgi:glycerophosphoryl diester phosphodiesterase
MGLGVRRQQSMVKPLILAHRGMPEVAPENTMTGFELACEVGADGLEFDVHLSKDDEIVVCHDATLERTTNGRGRIKDYTLAELRRLDAGSWFDHRYAGERLPTAREVFALAAERGLFINIELKSGLVLYPGLEEKVAALISEYGLAGRSIVSSFNHYSLVHLKQVAPGIPTGILYEAGLFEPWVYARHARADAIHPYFRGVFRELVEGAHAAGVRVHPWTVNDPDDFQTMLAAGVDAVITNCADRLLALRDGEFL